MALSELTTYIEDDWDDNALTGRSNPEEGYFLHPSDGLQAAGDYEPGDALKGVYRPEWVIVQGSPASTNGSLTFTNGGRVKVPTDFTTGSWAFSITVPNDPGTGEAGQTVIRASDGYWDNGFAQNQSHFLTKEQGGTRSWTIDSSTWSTGVTHTTEVTRDSYGNWEQFLDGTSKGTATDTFLPTIDRMELKGFPVETNLNNLQVG